MKPLYTKKNGTSQRGAAIEVKMPASYPSSNVTYGSGSVEDALDNKKYSGTGTTNASGELVLNLPVDDYKVVNMRVLSGADLCHAFPSVSSTGTIIIVVLNRSTSQPMANTSVSFDLYYM